MVILDDGGLTCPEVVTVEVKVVGAVDGSGDGRSDEWEMDVVGAARGTELD